MVTAGFILGVAYATLVLVAASHHGRQLRLAHRLARVAFIVGIALLLPVMLVGTFGLPEGSSFRWLGVLANVGRLGLWLAVIAAITWLVADSIFVWRERRRMFPFAFRGPPGGES